MSRAFAFASQSRDTPGSLEATDHELLEAARTGDNRALEALLERHEDRIYRFGMKMCGHPEDAEDVLQDTLLTVARSIGDFRGNSSLSTWLYAIARSLCIKKRRRSKFAPKYEHSLEDDRDAEVLRLASPGKAPEEAAFGREIQVALDKAIRALEPEQREVLLLRDVEGLKASEVGEVLGISVAAVKSRLHRARVRVRELVSPTLGIPQPHRTATSGCPDVLSMYSKYLEDDISSEVCAQMEKHLEGCERCRNACDSLKRTVALCSHIPAARVPTSVQDSVRSALREFLSTAG